MPASSFPEYAQGLRDALDALVASGRAVRADIGDDGRSALRGYIAGQILFPDHSQLHFREFVDLTRPDPRAMYAYHYQNAANELIFRYDNARHRPALPHAEHRHGPVDVRSSHAPTLSDVLLEILADVH